ncbi:MAG: transporter substrate-binding domain-containing protein [Synergistaceae bacterium]|nr:transporter substrate-binding domain-containing protein [Synergistaceae bacterium]
MKKIIIFVVLVLGAVYFFSNKYFYKPPVLRIGSECDYIPNSWEENFQSDSNIPVTNHKGYYAEGYDIQIANLVAKELGMTPSVVKLKWEDLIEALLRREIDVIFSSMLDTEERKRLIDFSIPYELKKTEYAVMVRKDGKFADITKLEDLYQARILSQKGTYFEDAIEQIPGAVKATPVITVSDMIEELDNGKVDGIVIDVDTGTTYEKMDDDLKLITFPEGEGFIIGFSGVCAGVRKNDRRLLERIDTAISKITLRTRQKVRDQVISKVWHNNPNP